MKPRIYTKKEQYCLNCNNHGHNMKNCNYPITSYGIILLSFDMDGQKYITDQLINDKCTYDNTGILINEPTDIELFCEFKDKIKFLMIRRKHTLGFLEFIRGRYNIDNIDGIIFLFKQMTIKEIDMIKNLSFNNLWNEMWGEKKYKTIYQTEYNLSKDKLDKLRTENGEYLNLDFYINNVVPTWDCPEWGFPKGRRNFKEIDIDCAVREFKEETGYDNNDFNLLNEIDFMEENFIGTNGINYKHIYYLGNSITNKIPIIDLENESQNCEIGDIGYFTYEEAIKKIRPYHTDRKKLITNIYIHMMNFLIKNIKEVGQIN
jgi:ADP-ribose pyrophosphatase YjhB (NUDIX family)